MKKLLTFSVVLAASATIHAESLEEKKFWKGEMDYLNETLKSADKACDANFTFDWIDKPKLRENAEKHQNSPNGICGAVIDEVASICRSDEDSKQAVRSKIKGFTCGYQNPRALDLKGGIVKYLGNNEEANFSDWAKPWLEKHL
jgi:hypothetical protein